MNLVVNARDAMPAGGRLVIQTSVADLAEKEAERLGLATAPHVVLSVDDTGEGMDAETQKQIFEPFFTTKRPGEGTGLGLSVVYGIVKLNGGEIEVASAPGAGTRFRIYLPVADEAAVEHSSSPPAAVARAGTETILVVEDDELMRDLVRDVLEMNGYSVLTAASSEEALREAEDSNIDLVITDVVMPGMTGVDLAEKIREHHPRLQILFMSGYTDRALVARGVLEPGVNFISKPFSNRALTALAREILSSTDAT
jgi:CheY-like chemotaxis protein